MVQLTQSALEKLKEELKQRIEARDEIAANIKVTREMGDLRENAAYHEAKDKQGFNEGRILELEDLINQAEVVSVCKDCNYVSLGSTVELELVDKELKMSFQIVSFNEADPSQQKISDQSPLGQALIGKKINDLLAVETPGGLVNYKIINIK